MYSQPDYSKAIHRLSRRGLPLAWPEPIRLKKSFPHMGAFIPDLSTRDGAGWAPFQATVSRYDNTGAGAYTLSPSSDINASATGIAGVYPDYPNNKLYMVGVDNSTSAWLAYTSMNTKNMTVRAGTTLALGVYSSGGAFLQRAANNTDLLLYVLAAIASSPTASKRASIVESNGVATNATFTIGGALPQLFVSMGNYVYSGAYVTAAEDLAVVIGGIANSYGGSPVMAISRGGAHGFLQLGATTAGAATTLYQHGYVWTLNGPHHVTVNGFMYSYALGMASSTFVRSELDAFLHLCADRLGLPR